MSRTRRFLAVVLAFVLMPVAASIGGDEIPVSPDSIGDRFTGSGLPLDDDPCPPGAPERHFDVVAIEIPIVYNNWGDFDPHGRLFVLAEDENPIRADVAARFAEAGMATLARVIADPTSAPGALGHQFPTGLSNVPRLDPVKPSDSVQPFVIRAHMGDCVQVNLTNKLPEPVGFHVNGVVAPPGQGQALGENEPDLTLPATSHAYRFWMPDGPDSEGARLITSRADERFHTKHGLFGAIIAERPGTEWLAPNGRPLASGQEAMIVHPEEPDHREYVVIMHDEVELIDRSLNALPIIGPYNDYGPGTKAINLRSEHFMNRFTEHDQRGPQGSGELPRGHDKSMGYSSYTYGDPATFIPVSYVGDPTKFRLLGAGPGQHHSFHLHGGGIRWRASPVADDPQMDIGLTKDNPVPVAPSERQDVQNVGPGESFNLMIEGGAGGVQQTVGDLLFHCHVVEHYVAGMWSFWRIVNTLRDDLAELPDRQGLMPEGVNSTELKGKTLRDGTQLDTDEKLRAWIESLLPPQGEPGVDDASVWDWTFEENGQGSLALGEPASEFTWANHESENPGERPELLFEPDSGRLSYPFVTPQLGKRPPFSAGHSPAPYLGEEVEEGRPDGLCPPDAPRREYNVVALKTSVRYNDHFDIDFNGQVFVLAEDKKEVLKREKPAENLVLRANQGDCVDVTLTSQLPEDPEAGEHSKVNMHIHLVQFDVQASDGVITGFNHEQSVRPAQNTGTKLKEPASAGDTELTVWSPSDVRVGTTIGIGLTETTLESALVIDVQGSTITLDRPLEHDHDKWERIGPEFVRYRWYADVELGMVYWHDHVDGLNSWRHGLFGGLVVEPQGSDWRDPKSGTDVRSGSIADIITPEDSYREIVLSFQDRSARMWGRDLASFNLRSEPFDRRNNDDPLATLDGNDPATPMLEAYPDDDVVIRLLYAGQSDTRAVATFGVTGHRFPYEQHLEGSRSIDSLPFSISAQHNLRLECGAGGCQGLPGDYLYSMTEPELLERGAWGILRVHNETQADLLPLPDNENWQPGSLPPDAPVRSHNVVALEHEVTLNHRFNITQIRKIFVPAALEQAVRDGLVNPEPWIARALPGEIIEIHLTNTLDEPVTMNPTLLSSTPGDGLGIRVGKNPDDSVAPGETGTYRWYADKEVGTVHIASMADPAQDALDGLYGALIVEPAGSTFHPVTGASSDLTLADGTAVREHVLLYASNDPVFHSSQMPYRVDVQGPVTINYRTEPLHDRLGGRIAPLTQNGDPMGGTGIHSCQLNNDTCAQTIVKPMRLEARNPLNPFVYSTVLFGDPETPILDAERGQPLVVRAVGAAGDQLQTHYLAGHQWRKDPDLQESNMIHTATLGPRTSSDAWLTAGPGGAGDYLYGTHRAGFMEAGAWGILRVEGSEEALLPLVGPPGPAVLELR